jgi:DNA-binding NarL/FixJ family response regulator
MATKSALSGWRQEGAEPLTVLIADDHPLMVAGIRRMLERDAAISVVGEAHSGPELLAMVERRRPQIVLMDLRMPGVSGADCIEQLTSTWPDLRVVVLSACDDRASIDGALAAGASAYAVKSIEPTDVASVIKRAARAGRQDGHEPVVAARPAGRSRGAPGGLTRREHVILEAVAAGKTTSAISKDLWVTEHTIKFHLTNIYRKLGVANRAAAIRYAIDNQLVAR